MCWNPPLSSGWALQFANFCLTHLKMPSVWAPPRARTYWESWTCTQGSFLSGKSSLCLSITSSSELPNREGVTMARLLWSISSKVGLRRPWRLEEEGGGRFMIRACCRWRYWSQLCLQLRYYDWLHVCVCTCDCVKVPVIISLACMTQSVVTTQTDSSLFLPRENDIP